MKKSIVLILIIMGFLFCPGGSEIDKILQIPENFQPTYTVVEVEDVSHPGVIRKTIRATVPAGMSEAGITLKMKPAVRMYHKQCNADAISIFV